MAHKINFFNCYVAPFSHLLAHLADRMDLDGEGLRYLLILTSHTLLNRYITVLTIVISILFLFVQANKSEDISIYK